MSPGPSNTSEDRARRRRELELTEGLDLRAGTPHRRVMLVLEEGPMLPAGLELVLEPYGLVGPTLGKALRELEEAGLVARSARAWGLTERGAIRLSDLKRGVA